MNKALQTFGLSPGYTQEELHAAYRKRAAHYHPDRSGSEKLWKAFQADYEFLKNLPAPEPKEWVIEVDDIPENFFTYMITVALLSLVVMFPVWSSIPDQVVEPEKQTISITSEEMSPEEVEQRPAPKFQY